MGRDGDATADPIVVGPARLLQDVMDRMLTEYSDRLAPGSIVRCVARCTRMTAGIRIDDPEDFVWVVENLARSRIDARLGFGQVVPPRRDLAESDQDVELGVDLRSLTP